jgi:histidine triad (HIT) family protein
MTIFSRIIAGEIPCYKVAENERYFAFLDISPMTKGHTLVVPKTEVDYLFDLSEEDYAGLMQFARQVAVAIKAAIPCKRVGVAVLGMEVPHAHIHLVPLQTEGDMNFRNPKLKLEPSEMQSVAKSIAEKL